MRETRTGGRTTLTRVSWRHLRMAKGLPKFRWHPWGIELDPEAATDRHVSYVVDRTARLEQRGLYWRLLTGQDCGNALDTSGQITPE